MGINVTDHGVQGNGTADDGIAIEKLLNNTSLVPEGSVVYFPPGNYKIETTISIDRGHITMLGTDGAVLTYTGPGECLVKTTWGHITFEALTFKGAGINTSTTGASNITIQHCMFNDMADNPSCLACDGSGYKILHNQFINKGLGQNGGLHFYNVSDLRVENNCFDFVKQPFGYVCNIEQGTPHNSDNIKIIGNYAKNISRVGIELINPTGNATPNPITGLEIKDNHLEDWHEFHWEMNWTEQMGISVSFEGVGAVISGNTLKWGDITHARHCWGIEICTYDALIENNYVEGFREGISTSHSRNNIYRNNVLKNIHDIGITNYDWTDGEIGLGARFDGCEYEGNKLINIGKTGITGTWDRTMGTNPMIIRNNTIFRTPGHFPDDANEEFVGIDVNSKPIDVIGNTIHFEKAPGSFSAKSMRYVAIKTDDVPQISGNKVINF